MEMNVVNKKLLATQGGSTIVRGVIYLQEDMGRETRLWVKCRDGGFPTKVTIPSGIVERREGYYKGVNFKIY